MDNIENNENNNNNNNNNNNTPLNPAQQHTQDQEYRRQNAHRKAYYAAKKNAHRWFLNGELNYNHNKKEVGVRLHWRMTHKSKSRYFWSKLGQSKSKDKNSRKKAGNAIVEVDGSEVCEICGHFDCVLNYEKPAGYIEDWGENIKTLRFYHMLCYENRKKGKK